MKSKFFLTAALPLMAAALALVFTGCSNDDDFIPESREGQTVDEGYTIFSTGTPGTRTTAGQIPMDKDGNVTGPLPFYWTNGDYIYVKDDNGKWQKSEPLDIPHYSWGWPTASFKVPGKFSPDKRYEVRYTGYNKYNVDYNKGNVFKDQSQHDPIRATVYDSGDCGIDTAKWENGHYTFTLKHKVAFLCLLPYSTNEIARDHYMLRYVRIFSEDYISGPFKINDRTGEIAFSGFEHDQYKQILLMTGGGSWINLLAGTWVRTPKPDPTYCAFYVPILPGTHKLRLVYHQEFQTDKEIYGNETEHELGEVTLEPGKVYTVKTDLKAPKENIGKIN